MKLRPLAARVKSQQQQSSGKTGNSSAAECDKPRALVDKWQQFNTFSRLRDNRNVPARSSVAERLLSRVSAHGWPPIANPSDDAANFRKQHLWFNSLG
jgi:hypothetical protein